MKGYNLYLKNEKINSTPLTKEDVEFIKENTFINKKIDDSTIKKIFVKDIRVVECTIV